MFEAGNLQQTRQPSASVTLDINDRELLALFNGLLDRGQDLGPIWHQFGDHTREVPDAFQAVLPEYRVGGDDAVVVPLV